MKKFDISFYNEKIKIIAGVDEAGRGPLAGPVVAAAVVFQKDCFIPGVNDSKKLPATKREFYEKLIKEKALSYGYGVVNEKEIDKINILQASLKAMKIAVSKLCVKPDLILIDGNKIFKSNIMALPIVKGDIDYINEVKDFQTKLARFEEFWKRLDPSPNTVENETLNEYYRRVEYANANFKGYFKGWRSDMGMVYITLGPPDQVTRRPYELSSKPYEIWDYYVLNRSFVFVDQTNFGDYRLENPAFGDWFRYRP